MKLCTWCGKKYPDETEVCPVDGKPLQREGEQPATFSRLPAIPSEETVSAQENQFWAQMNFRRFAALMLRIQALWLLFYAGIQVTYLLPSFRLIAGIWSPYGISTSMKFELFLHVLRIGLHIGVALAVIQNAERLLAWLVKDWVRNTPTKGESTRPPS